MTHDFLQRVRTKLQAGLLLSALYGLGLAWMWPGSAEDLRYALGVLALVQVPFGVALHWLGRAQASFAAEGTVSSPPRVLSSSGAGMGPPPGFPPLPVRPLYIATEWSVPEVVHAPPAGWELGCALRGATAIEILRLDDEARIRIEEVQIGTQVHSLRLSLGAETSKLQLELPAAPAAARVTLRGSGSGSFSVRFGVPVIGPPLSVPSALPDPYERSPHV